MARASMPTRHIRAYLDRRHDQWLVPVTWSALGSWDQLGEWDARVFKWNRRGML